MKRTDAHAPASPNFDPEAYDCWGVFDTAPDNTDSAARGKAVTTLLDKGYRIGSGSSAQCGHCGTFIRYAALMVRYDMEEFIFVGQDCLINRFEDLTKAEFTLLRKAAKLNRERASKKQVAEQTFSDNPWLAEIPTYGGTFLDSLYEQAQGGKSLTEKQIEAGIKALDKAKEREEQFQARKAQETVLIEQGVQAPEGKVIVTGTVLSVKWQESAYGGSLKMLVESDEGWKVWSSVPKSLQGTSALVGGEEWKFSQDVQAGERIEFTATLTPSDKDPLFAFAKRPTKAQVLTTA
jgi:hypothetical protein